MNPNAEQRVEPQKTVSSYGVKGGQKVPGSGRKPGTPNKRKVIPVEQVLEKVAEDLGLEAGALEVMAIYRLYLVLHQQDERLGLPKGTITFDMSLQAAFKLMPFELPKKRSIEVTGLGLNGVSYVISTGTPPPVGETSEMWGERARRETEDLEISLKKKRLADLEEEQAAEKAARSSEKLH